MGPALLVIGLIINLVGWIMVVYIAFRESVWWGLASLFIPFAYIFFVITHWDDTKRGFLISVVGTVILVVSIMAIPRKPKEIPKPAEVTAAVPDTTTHATFESVTRPVPAPAPAPQPQVEEPVQPLITQVYADNQTRLYYPKDCATHPENAFLLAKSVAIRQGYKPGQCR